MNERTSRHEDVVGCNPCPFGAHLRSSGDGAREDSGRSSLGIVPTLARWFCAIALVIFLTACNNPFAKPAALVDTRECLSRLAPVTVVSSVYVLPDDGYSPILDEIRNARCTIDLSMYLLTDPTVIESLKDARNRGVRIRVILEREPFGTWGTQQEQMDTLVALGAEVRWSPERFNYSHAKYMVLDSQTVVISNQNFTQSAFTRNREYGVVSTEPSVVAQAQAIFEADWNDRSELPAWDALVVSPGNARHEVLALINNSQVQLWMYAEVLRDEEVTQAMNAAADRGVDVRLLVNPSIDSADAPYFLDAMSHGVQIRELEQPYVHAKAMIVDGQAVLIGSHNYSYTSLDLNREVGIVLTDMATIEKATAVYERDWTRAVPVDRVSLTPAMAPYRMYVQSLEADSRMHVRG